MVSLFYNNLVLLLIFIITIKLNSYHFKIDSNLFNFFLFYHGAFTLLYILMFRGQASDYYTYLYLVNTDIGTWEDNRVKIFYFLSTNLIYNIIIFFKSIFLNDFSIIVIFSLISFFGIIVFIKNLIKLGVDEKIAYIVFLIPGFHFWTGVIGKDCLILFFLAYFFYFYIDKKFIYSIIFLIPVFMIRPHIGIIFFISVAINEVISKKVHITLILLSVSLFSIYIFFNIPQIHSLFFNSDDALSYNLIQKIFIELNSHVGKFSSSGSGYQVSNLYANIFNYLIFPLEFILRNNSLTVNGFIFMEILTLIFLMIIISKQKNEFKINKRIMYFLCICIFVYLMLLPQIFFNFGLNARQKWMIVPFIIYFLFLLKNLFVRRKKI